MDEKNLELAENLTLSIIEVGIQKSRQSQKRPEDFTGDCECGEPIPDARIAYGYYNCVPCQELLERKSNRR